MNKKSIITALLALVAMAGQGQIPTGLPEYVKNYQMNMEAPLPEHFHKDCVLGCKQFLPIYR